MGWRISIARLLALLWLQHIQSIASREYEDSCNGIEASTQKAMQLRRLGRVQEAFGAVDEARAYFRKAVQLEPQEAAAYVDLAQSMLHTQHLDEAVQLWEAALDRPLDAPVAAWVKGRLRWTKYGRVSMQRDAVYNGGQGDLLATIELIAKQIEIYPKDPNLHLAKATTSVMVSDVRRSTAEAAVLSFSEAQSLAYEAWRAGLHVRGRAEPKGACTRAADDNGTALQGLIYNWPAWYAEFPADSALRGLEYANYVKADSDIYGPSGDHKDTQGYIATFADVGLSGDDGVIVDEASCHIFVPSTGVSMDLAQNLQLLQTWGDPPTPQAGESPFSWFPGAPGSIRTQMPNVGQILKPQVLAKAASILQFAALSHFHVLTEVFGRLSLLHSHGLLDDKEVYLIAAGQSSKKSFMSEALSVLVPELSRDRIVWWQSDGMPDVRMQVHRLYYPNWQPPTDLGKDGGHCATPRSVLRLARQSLLRAWVTSPTEPGVVLFVKRWGNSMRGRLHGEQQLWSELVDIVKQLPMNLVVKDFDGSASPKKTVKLFARSQVVVGLHGGALANILFAPEGARLFEIGFASPFAGHYRHLAAALGVEVTLIPLASDPRGIGASDVSLADPEDARKLLHTALQQMADKGKSKHEL